MRTAPHAQEPNTIYWQAGPLDDGAAGAGRPARGKPDVTRPHRDVLCRVWSRRCDVRLVLFGLG